MSSKDQVLSRVLKHYGLNETDKILYTEVSEAHIQEIAEAHCREWPRLPVFLCMENPRKVPKDIEDDVRGAKKQRVKFFDVWKTEKKTDATYYALINALVSIKEREDAEFVCSLLEKADVPQGKEGQRVPSILIHLT